MGVPAATGSRDADKVEYQSINFDVTEGLRKTREDVENQRSREIEWLQQRGQSLKILTTADAKYIAPPTLRLRAQNVSVSVSNSLYYILYKSS